MQNGYERRQAIQRELNLESWRRARMISYYSVLQFLPQHTSMTDFMKLEGDPVFDTATAERQALEAIREAERQGWLKKGTA